MKRKVIIMITMLCIVLSSISIVFAGENRADLTASKKWKFSESYFGGVKKAYIIPCINFLTTNLD